MKLKEYLKSIKMTQKQFAAKMKLSQQTVSQVCNGHSPKRSTMLKIVKRTKGHVTIADLWDSAKKYL